jgi:zinc transport system permease protein
MLILLCASVVLLMRIAGLIMVMALLSIPASIAEKHSKQLGGMMILSGIISAISIFGGLMLATMLNLTPSAVIVAILAVIYLVNLFIYKK